MTSTPQQQLLSSDFNLERLNTEQLERHISASIDAESNIAIFGYRGSGKTAISHQRIELANHYEAYMNLSVYEKTDLCGYPLLLNHKDDKVEHFVKFMLPAIFQPMIETDKPVVLLLDEVDKAASELWAPLLELTQEKSINGRKLTNLKCCIMTGNLISEGGQRPSLPLLDRTEAYLIETSALYWLRWAASVPEEIHPSVYTFITDHPNSLHTVGGVDENYKAASPRGWHLSSRLISIGERKGWDTHLLNEKVAGQVGKKEALAYKIYYQNYKVLLPLVDAVFADKPWHDEWKGLTPTEKLYASTIICSRFATQLDNATPETPPASIKMVGKFMQKAGSENVVMGVRSQLKLDRIVRYTLDEHLDWKDVLFDTHNSLSS